MSRSARRSSRRSSSAALKLGISVLLWWARHFIFLFVDCLSFSRISSFSRGRSLTLLERSFFFFTSSSFFNSIILMCRWFRLNSSLCYEYAIFLSLEEKLWKMSSQTNIRFLFLLFDLNTIIIWLLVSFSFLKWKKRRRLYGLSLYAMSYGVCISKKNLAGFFLFSVLFHQ